MPSSPANQSLQALHGLLSTGRFDYADEQTCQQQIATFLARHNVPFQREFKLGSRYIDFYFPRSKLGLEIKASKQLSRRAVYRQCKAYCEFEELSGLLLATGRYQGLPSEIEGKPTKVLQLGVAFL